MRQLNWPRLGNTLVCTAVAAVLVATMVVEGKPDGALVNYNHPHEPPVQPQPPSSYDSMYVTESGTVSSYYGTSHGQV